MRNYDPDGKPELDEEALLEAESHRLYPIYITCHEPGAKVGDPSGVSFVSFGHCLPRVGERIELEGGKLCEVRRVYHKLSRCNNWVMLVPTVVAVLISAQEE